MNQFKSIKKILLAICITMSSFVLSVKEDNKRRNKGTDVYKANIFLKQIKFFEPHLIANPFSLLHILSCEL